MNKLILIASSLFLLQGCFVKENPVSSSMKGDSFLKEILKNKENYEIQIIYTEIKRDKEPFAKKKITLSIYKDFLTKNKV